MINNYIYILDNTGDFTSYAIATVMFLIAIAICVLRDRIKKKEYKKYKKNNSLKESELRKIFKDFNMECFLNNRFNDFKEIQELSSTHNYEALRNKVTDNLYNELKGQYDILKSFGKTNKIENITYEDSYIKSLNKENGIFQMVIVLYVSYKNYIKKENNIVSGTNNFKDYMHYELTFVCNKDNVNNNCPNCGASLNDNSSQVCPYCNSVIDRIGANWILSRIDIKSSSQKENKNIESLNYIIEKDPNFSESIFISKVKNTYIMLMKSITENNIDKVKYKLSDELYNKILEEMKYYDMKALAQVYDEIKIKNAYIIDTSENNNEFKILVLLDVKYKFYTVNKKTKKPNFLSYNKKVEKQIYLVFSKKVNAKENSISPKCKSCGANLDINSTGTCSYCGTTYKLDDYDWILTYINM